MASEGDDRFDIRVGVLLEPAPVGEAGADVEEDDEGHVPASYHGRHRSGGGIVRVGSDVLRAAAEAVGREVALVVGGVVAGMGPESADAAAFVVEDLELTFGVKATLATGKAVEALFTAAGEATVEVKLTLRRPGG